MWSYASPCNSVVLQSMQLMKHHINLIARRTNDAWEITSPGYFIIAMGHLKQYLLAYNATSFNSYRALNVEIFLTPRT